MPFNSVRACPEDSKKLPLRGKTSPAPGEDVAQRQKGESGNAVRH
mgnify:CR=1 FL=1